MGKILNFEPPLAECLRRRTESNRCATRRIGRVHRRLPLAGSVQKFSLPAQNLMPSPLSDGAWTLLVTIEAKLPPGCPRDNPQKNKDLADTAHCLRTGLK
jgi:hypothetical protein